MFVQSCKMLELLTRMIEISSLFDKLFIYLFECREAIHLDIDL